LLFLVPLASTTQSEQQTLFEKQSLVKTPQVAETQLTEPKDNESSAEKVDTHSVNSESDNETVTEVIDSGNKANANVNIDDEFEKILTPKIENLASSGDESTESVDQEIIEILSEKAPANESSTGDATSINIIAQTDTLESEKISAESVAKIDTTEFEEKIEKNSEELEKIDAEPVEASIQVESAADIVDNAQTTDEIESEKIEPNENATIDETKPINETLIDEHLLSREAILKSIADAAAEKPPVPIQTYLWEDIKRSKEQVSGDQVCNPHVPFLQYKNKLNLL
jgi:hypothetical protein